MGMIGFVALFASVAAGGELTVSPDGLQPGEALEKIRAAKAAGDDRAWTVHVAAGRYELDRPLVFRPEDSGTVAAPVTWIGESGKSVLTGLSRIGGWTRRGAVWEAPAPRDAAGKIRYFESLYVNGRRAARSPIPKRGGVVPVGGRSDKVADRSGRPGYWVESFAVTNGAVKAALDKVTADELPYVSTCIRRYWAFARRATKAYDPKTGRVSAWNPRHGWVPWMSWDGEADCFFENVRAAFTEPGEWFYDVPNGKILYRPLPGERLDETVFTAPLARLPRLVEFKGDPKGGRFVHDVTFRNLVFEGSACRADDGGTGPTQSYMRQSASWMDGALYAEGVHRLALEFCAFRRTENHGVRLDAGCCRNRIENCLFEDLGAGGVWMGAEKGTPPPGREMERRQLFGLASESTAFNRIENCIVRKGGRFNPEATGVVMANVSDSVLTHCDIHDFFYSGVSVGWVWGYKGSVAQRNEISFNRIWNLGQGVMSDMGGVYTLGTSFGTVVSNNVIHGVTSKKYGGWGLYTDEGSEGIVMENNLVYDTADGCFHQHFGTGCLIRNNIFAWNRGGGAVRASNPNRDGRPSTINVAGNITITKGCPLVGPNARKTGGLWASNLWYDFGGKGVFDGLGWKEWQAARLEYGGVYADPMFEDAEKLDFRLKPGSPAFALGFRPFDWKAAGYRSGWTSARTEASGDFRERDGLARTLAKLRAGQEVAVAYFGGSITEMNGWRNMTTEWLGQEHKAKIREIYAAIGGTGTDLGVYRLRKDVLDKKPDLVFVEFAVNDACQARQDPAKVERQVEGIVRQTWRTLPNADLFFVYTIRGDMTNDYLNGRMPASTAIMEKIAGHYGIPSLDLGARVARMIRDGKIVFDVRHFADAVPQQDAERDRKLAAALKSDGRLLFSNDAAHPRQEGHALYLKSVQTAFRAMKASQPADHAARLATPPLRPDNLEDAQVVPVDARMLAGEGWSSVPDDVPFQKTYRNRLGQVWCCDRPGSRLKFRFRGTCCRIYDIVGPDAPTVDIFVDGVKRRSDTRFDIYCTYYRPTTFDVFDGPDGVHEVEIAVSPKEPDRTTLAFRLKDPEKELAQPKYHGTRFRPAQLLVTGTVLDD